MKDVLLTIATFLFVLTIVVLVTGAVFGFMAVVAWLITVGVTAVTGLTYSTELFFLIYGIVMLLVLLAPNGE